MSPQEPDVTCEQCRALREELARRMAQVEYLLGENTRLWQQTGERAARHMPGSPWATPEESEGSPE